MWQEADGPEVFGRHHRQSDGVTHSFMERCVRPASEDGRLVSVEHEVLDVTHLVVDGLQLFLVQLAAHLDPKREGSSRQSNQS